MLSLVAHWSVRKRRFVRSTTIAPTRMARLASTPTTVREPTCPPCPWTPPQDSTQDSTTTRSTGAHELGKLKEPAHVDRL